MKINWQKVAIIGIPTVAAIGIGYWLYMKYSKPPKKSVSLKNPASVPPKKLQPVSVSSSGSYPLMQGSNNALVKQLQTALGVTADGIFGANTLAALKAQYGVTSVPNAATLASITGGTASASQATLAAQSLSDQFANGGLDIWIGGDYFATEVTEDSSGNMTYTGYGFDMTYNETYDNTYFQLDGATMMGMCILRVSSGTLQGEYLVPPSIVRLVAHQDPAVAPDPNSILATPDAGSGIVTF